MHAPPSDNLIAQSTSIFKQFLLAHNALEIGGDTIASFSDNACIEATVGLNVEIEPIPLYEAKENFANILSTSSKFKIGEDYYEEYQSSRSLDEKIAVIKVLIKHHPEIWGK